MSEKEVNVILVGAKSIGQYGGYESFINKLLEYHKDEENLHYYVYCKANGSGCMDIGKLPGAKAVNETEFIYIAGGKGTFSINTNFYHVSKGDILIVEKGAIHSLISDKDAPLDCWTCAAYDYKLCDRIYVGFMLPANVCPHMKAGIHEPLIQSIFHELNLLRTFPSNTRISTSDILGTALVNIYYEIFRENPTMERRKDSSFAQNILIYVNENYNKKITLKLLSEHFHISADYISHEFRKIYGISPINYVIDRRLNDAKWLLINTDKSLVSISEKVGYENTSYFSKLFEKRIHYSPLEFREKYKK